MMNNLPKTLQRIVPKIILNSNPAKSFARKLVNCLFGWNILRINVKLYLDLKNKIDVNILNGSESELQNLFIYHVLLDEQDVVLDVGAQCGMHAIFLAKNVVTQGRVCAIEQSPLLLKRLKKNIRLNRSKNIIVVSSINEALSHIAIHKIKLIHVAASSHMDFEVIKDLIQKNRSIVLIWESNAIQNLETLTRRLFHMGMNCRLIQNGRFFPIDSMDRLKEGTALLASNQRHTVTVMEDELHELIEENNTAKVKISGFSLLRSASLYPFELCYESVLDFVDEFVLAVDKNPPKSPFGRDWSNEVLIDEFLAKTRYAEKVRIIKFDFKTRYYQNYNPIGRWIADVNNRALEACSNDICVYVMADEMYHEETYSRDITTFIESEYDALSYYFLHFVGDLSHIIDINHCTYTHAIRIFRRDKFYSYYDGYSFQSLRSGNVRIQKAKLPIYHIGYVVNFKEKQSEHAGKGGLFKGVQATYIENFATVPLYVPLPKYAYIDKYRSSRKMMQFL